MNIKKAFSLFAVPSLLALCGCGGKEFKADNFTAYFGGEVTNPTNRYVLFYKDETLIDSILLDDENQFFIKFDSLAPGMYSFKYEPEYQYVYFDKNDSLMVSINSQDFDNSIVFSGRGDQKNNFLMELYLSNEKDREKMFDVFDYDVAKFNSAIDKVHNANLKLYEKKKAYLQWSDDFDLFVRASIDYPYYSRKELYPVIHQMRTGNDVIERLPKNYYSYRKTIDYNNVQLSHYSPFVRYLSHMLNNMATINYHNHFTQADLALKTNIHKMDIADTLIKNETIKNIILNNIAFSYLLEDQNVVNNQKFLDTYQKYSTDKTQKNDIIKIGHAIQLLKNGNQLPEAGFVDAAGNKLEWDSENLKNVVFFFWTQKATGHLMEAHKKAIEFERKFPEFKFIAINVDENQENWVKTLARYNFDSITQWRATDFETLRDRWAITKIHRTIILGPDGKIKNAFTNLFDAGFEENLK